MKLLAISRDGLVIAFETDDKIPALGQKISFSIRTGDMGLTKLQPKVFQFVPSHGYQPDKDEEFDLLVYEEVA